MREVGLHIFLTCVANHNFSIADDTANSPGFSYSKADAQMFESKEF